MAIKFTKCSFKNFLSTGNQPNTFELDRVPSILITGQNGAGKSTLLDAITFGIYGKPYRNINKPQLVNSVNEKGLEVIVEFSINDIPYKVIRGIKPTKFEIYKNNELIPHDAAAKDYQAKLEDLLGLDYRAFCQVVIIGSARYQSFMDLNPNDRRGIIEEILDITIFSKMNGVLKDKLSHNGDKTSELNYKYEILRNKSEQQKKTIDLIIKNSDENKGKLEAEKARIKLNIDKLEESLDELDKELDSLEEKDIDDLHDKLSKVKTKAAEVTRKEDSAKSKMAYYQLTDTCDTCHQTIDSNIKEEQIIIATAELEEVERIKVPMFEAYTKLKDKIDEAHEIRSKVIEVSGKRRELMAEKATYDAQLDKIDESLKTSSTEDLKTSLAEREETENEMEEVSKKLVDMSEERHYLDICKILLKDEGIKSKIIKQYLPLMNQLINKYLDRMGASYSFHLDEQFNEVIKSRYRDSFSYASFSEGEKSRISLALVFTWREIAKIKNSVNTNLLIMDEVGDSSLDAEGSDSLWEILKELDNTNVFVISHKISNVEKFSSHIEIQKQGNFSKIANSKY